jgi:hypothetical protein
MPGFIIDGGRLLVVPIIFSLSAALAALGLVPCWFLYHEVQAALGDFIAFLSVPFLYFVWGVTYCAAAIVFKWAIFYRPRAGQFGLYTWPVVGWGLTGAVTNFANIMFLVHFKGTPLLNVWFRALGVKLGHRVTINTVRIFDWDLVNIDDDVVLGGDCVVMAHSLEGGQMHMRPIHIGRGATIGGEAKVMPGCTIGEKGILGASSVLTKQSTIPPHELWGGLPARFIKFGKGHPQAQALATTNSSPT